MISVNEGNDCLGSFEFKQVNWNQAASCSPLNPLVDTYGIKYCEGYVHTLRIATKHTPKVL